MTDPTDQVSVKPRPVQYAPRSGVRNRVYSVYDSAPACAEPGERSRSKALGRRLGGMSGRGDPTRSRRVGSGGAAGATAGARRGGAHDRRCALRRPRLHLADQRQRDCRVAGHAARAARSQFMPSLCPMRGIRMIVGSQGSRWKRPAPGNPPMRRGTPMACQPARCIASRRA